MNGESLLVLAAAAPRPAHHPPGEDVTGLYVALVVAVGALVAVAVARARSRRPGYVKRLTERLAANDVLVRAGALGGCRTCWHCGAADAPHRPTRFLKTVFMVVIIGGESRVMKVPLCDEHRTPNTGPRYARMLSPLLGFLTFAGTAQLLHVLGRAWMWPWLLFSLAAGAAAGLLLKRWADRAQTFRLMFADDKLGLAIIRFSDPERARAVREEVGETGLSRRTTASSCSIKE